MWFICHKDTCVGDRCLGSAFIEGSLRAESCVWRAACHLRSVSLRPQPGCDFSGEPPAPQPHSCFGLTSSLVHSSQSHYPVYYSVRNTNISLSIYLILSLPPNVQALFPVPPDNYKTKTIWWWVWCPLSKRKQSTEWGVQGPTSSEGGLGARVSSQSSEEATWKQGLTG